ncbi:DNA methylase [Natranaerovirga pectinivora]|uniref:Methyltransferase n=1 Tax=Natranaerovirga pectinivora TaxID=682400 RepID=A0A4R3MSA0_9FIRM|nr:DNA methyltransferase [Natranaerovirga pectinivora]TCT16308.1 DNA methylase [Natranaerovirga pectinivora]
MELISQLEKIMNEESPASIKLGLENMTHKLEKEEEVICYPFDNKTLEINRDFLLEYINNMIEQSGKDRILFYYERLFKALTEVKTRKYNDINLNRWKEYEDILTDSLWIIKQRDNSGSHSGDYWGNFVPQIPNQLLRRYTKEGEWVLDPFLGSGTTLIEASLLGRNGIGIELQESVGAIAKKRIDEVSANDLESKIVIGDSANVDLDEVMKELGIKKVQFVLMHPPYWDIIRFSEEEACLSNTNSLEGFLDGFGKVIENTTKYLEKGRFAAVVIGDKYEGGKWVPLGFNVMEEFTKRGFKLKSIVVKNFEETKGKRNQRNLWKYRALAGGFYIFKHEYIFIFQK